MKLVSCFVLALCVGAVISTTITADEYKTFNSSIDNGIISITTPVAALNIVLTDPINFLYTDAEPYKSNDFYLDSKQSSIDGYLANSFSLIRNEVKVKLRADVQRAFDDFDTYKSVVTTNISITSGCTKTLSTLNDSIHTIFNDGVDSSRNCFINAPSVIFPSINDDALIAALLLPEYSTKSLVCVAGNVLISNPLCYSIGFLSNSPPKPVFDALQKRLESLTNFAETGNVDALGYTPCTKTAQNIGISSYRKLYTDNPNCFNDYRAALSVII